MGVSLRDERLRDNAVRAKELRQSVLESLRKFLECMQGLLAETVRIMLRVRHGATDRGAQTHSAAALEQNQEVSVHFVDLAGQVFLIARVLSDQEPLGLKQEPMVEILKHVL